MNAESLRRIGPEVVGVVGYAVTVALLSTAELGGVLRFVLVAPLLLVLPGYALTTALFPHSQYEPPYRGSDEIESTASRVDLVERAALSVGLSVALLPLVGMVYGSITGALQGPVVPAVAAFTVVTMAIGAYRRWRLPVERQFRIPVVEGWNSAYEGLSRSSSVGIALNAVLVFAVAAAVGALVLGVAAPQQGEAFTEFAVGTDDGGEFVTNDYPEEVGIGEPVELSLYIENREGREVTYTVVPQIQDVEDGEVVRRETLEQRRVTVGPDQSIVTEGTVEPTMEGEELRLVYLLYVDDSPAEPTRATRADADQSVYVWIDVDDA